MYNCKLKANYFLSHLKIGRVKVGNLTQEQMKILYDNNCQYIEFSKKEPEKQEEEEPKKTKSTIKK